MNKMDQLMKAFERAAKEIEPRGRFLMLNVRAGFSLEEDVDAPVELSDTQMEMINDLLGPNYKVETVQEEPSADECAACRWYGVFMGGVAGALPRAEYERLIQITRFVTREPPPHSLEAMQGEENHPDETTKGDGQ